MAMSSLPIENQCWSQNIIKPFSYINQIAGKRRIAVDASLQYSAKKSQKATVETALVKLTKIVDNSLVL